jgi:hypothetical protein
MQRIQTYPWYLGVPFDRHNGRSGISFMAEGFVVLRSECVRVADYPAPRSAATAGGATAHRGDALLGEIARQFGWTQAAHAEHVHLNLVPGENVRIPAVQQVG